MTPKEKAEELVYRYVNLYSHQTENYLDIDEAKQCALIAVDEILKEKNGCSKYECYGQDINWNEVKKEIENL
jgi:hypothetical protein